MYEQQKKEKIGGSPTRAPPPPPPASPRPVASRRAAGCSAPQDGTVGLRNPVSRDPVRERGDKVFGERNHATTGFFFNTDADDYFPDDDFFPDVDVLFGNMSAPNANGSSSSTGLYVILLCQFEILLQSSFLAICEDLLPVYSLLDGMTSLFPISLAMFYLLLLWIKSTGKLLIYSTIQKPYYRQFSPAGFAASLRPTAFDGVNYKKWRARATLWFETMKCFHATKGKPEGELNPDEEKAFQEADTLLKAAILSILSDKIVDPYVSITTGKGTWDALEAKFGVSDAGSELYVMEQFFDYKMTGERSIVEQAHEIQSIAKELEQVSCVLPDKFIAGGIIAKLPPSWRNFATSLKHKRQEFSVMDLIGSLDVEEKARAKDIQNRALEGGSTANFVQKKNSQSYKPKYKGKSKEKGKYDKSDKPSQSTNFKRKTDRKKGSCHVCGDPNHWAPRCPNRFEEREKSGKTANVVIADTEMKDAGYGIFPTVFSVCHSPKWWIDTGANVHICADFSMFSSYQATRTPSVLMGNGSHASVRGVGTVDLKFTSGKIVRLKNVHHVPSINKNLVSGSLLCRDGYRIVFESNKFVVSKFGTFIGKGYECGGLFRLSLSDICNKVVNHVCTTTESNV